MPLVYCRLLPLALQLGTAFAIGTAAEPVVLAKTELAAIDPRLAVPHAGAEEGPVEVITWPLLEPAGLSNWIGVSVAAPTEAAPHARRNAPIRFMIVIREWTRRSSRLQQHLTRCK